MFALESAFTSSAAPSSAFHNLTANSSAASLAAVLPRNPHDDPAKTHAAVHSPGTRPAASSVPRCSQRPPPLITRRPAASPVRFAPVLPRCPAMSSFFAHFLAGNPLHAGWAFTKLLPPPRQATEPQRLRRIMQTGTQ